MHEICCLDEFLARLTIGKSLYTSTAVWAARVGIRIRATDRPMVTITWIAHFASINHTITAKRLSTVCATCILGRVAIAASIIALLRAVFFDEAIAAPGVLASASGAVGATVAVVVIAIVTFLAMGRVDYPVPAGPLAAICSAWLVWQIAVIGPEIAFFACGSVHMGIPTYDKRAIAVAARRVPSGVTLLVVI